jgi:hypothetical protein
MPEPSTESTALQWKWVGITFVLYAVFYLLPLFLLGSVAETFSDIWVFAGIVIVAAIAGYWSPGVTIWEPAIAGGGLIFLFFLGFLTLDPPKDRVVLTVVPMLIVLMIVFLLSLFGAWLGERAQIRWRKKSP